jgi:hypothetical protein
MAKTKAAVKAKNAKKGKKGKKSGRSKPMTTTERKRLRGSTFAFPRARKEPLNDAKHVRNAIARFDQVDGVSDSARDAAWSRVKRAAKKFGVEVSERSWRELGRKPRSKKTKAGKGKKSRAKVS